MIDVTADSIVIDTLQWPHRIVVPIGVPVDTSDLELKPQGKLTVTIVKGNDLKNQEFIGKSVPYTVLYIRPLFKVKTKVIQDNLNPVWNETYDLIAEDKETQSGRPTKRVEKLGLAGSQWQQKATSFLS